MTRTTPRMLALGLLMASLGCTTTISPPEPVDPSMTAPRSTFSHAAFDAVLAKYVDGRGRVDYTALAQDTRPLDAYYATLAAASPDSHPDLFPTEDDRLAYWINAYNAGAIETVLHYYPIESVKDVRSDALFFLPKLAGFFYLQRIELGGKKTNLYDLENGLIRKRFLEPRIHFALNCASIGCPRLPRHAFHADVLQQQLEDETKLFMSEERNVDIDVDDGKIELSSIFDWYEKDFTKWMEKHHPETEPTLIEYVKLYLPDDELAELERCTDCKVEFIEYDWGLNDQREPDDDD